MEKGFEGCLYGIESQLRKKLEVLPKCIKESATEIRLRVNMPLSLTVKNRPLFLSDNGMTSYFPTENAVCCNKKEIDESFLLLTKRSVYAHIDEINEGYIKMENGSRAGISGCFSKKNLFDISGINIRIAKEIKGCGGKVFKELSVGGVLILGPPGRGKTTLLRDLIRLVSNEGNRVAVIDGRGEITAQNCGISPFDLGPNTDIYVISDKAKGMEMALRTGNPNIIAFDEIGNSREINAIRECLNSGITVIFTGHIGSIKEITRRPPIIEALKTGAVSQIVMMPEIIGDLPIVIRKEEWKNYDIII